MSNRMARMAAVVLGGLLAPQAWANEGQFTRFHVSFGVPWMAFIVFGLVILIPVVLMAVVSWKTMNKGDESDGEAKE